MVKGDDFGLFIVSIVAVVAIVSLFLISGSSQTSSEEVMVVDEEGNVAGQASFNFEKPGLGKNAKSDSTSKDDTCDDCKVLERALTLIYTANLEISEETYSFEAEFGDASKIIFTSWINGEKIERSLNDDGDRIYTTTYRGGGLQYFITVNLNSMQLNIETFSGKISSGVLYQEYKAVIKRSGEQYPMIANIDNLKLTFVSPCSGVTIERSLSLEGESYVALWRESGKTSTIIIDTNLMRATVPVHCI